MNAHGWEFGQAGESCTTVCENSGQTCGAANEDRMNLVSTGRDMQLVGQTVGIDAFGLPGPDPSAALTRPSRNTVFPQFDFYNINGETTCDASNPLQQRYCCCSSGDNTSIDVDCPLPERDVPQTAGWVYAEEADSCDKACEPDVFVAAPTMTQLRKRIVPLILLPHPVCLPFRQRHRFQRLLHRDQLFRTNLRLVHPLLHQENHLNLRRINHR